jgi:hypothetical protein
MLDAADALQCANFLFLHGYYRAAFAELRVALELVMIGAYGNLNPDDPKYVAWKTNGSELGFTSFRKKMHGMLRGDQCKWLLANEEFRTRRSANSATSRTRAQTPATARYGGATARSMHMKRRC